MFDLCTVYLRHRILSYKIAKKRYVLAYQQPFYLLHNGYNDLQKSSGKHLQLWKIFIFLRT
jgi:hypothetical protein